MLRHMTKTNQFGCIDMCVYQAVAALLLKGVPDMCLQRALHSNAWQRASVHLHCSSRRGSRNVCFTDGAELSAPCSNSSTRRSRTSLPLGFGRRIRTACRCIPTRTLPLRLTCVVLCCVFDGRRSSRDTPCRSSPTPLGVLLRGVRTTPRTSTGNGHLEVVPLECALHLELVPPECGLLAAPVPGSRFRAWV